jgi:hypothetical protein
VSAVKFGASSLIRSAIGFLPWVLANCGVAAPAQLGAMPADRWMTPNCVGLFPDENRQNHSGHDVGRRSANCLARLTLQASLG